jgi:trimeric autotransporter adhesin
LQISVKPTQLVWNLSGLGALSPNANVTQINPTTNDSVLVNGKWFYIYKLPLQYTFTQTGTFTIPINVFHPSIEGCSGSQEVTLNVNVIAAPVANFAVNFSGCVGDLAQFTGSVVTANGVPGSQYVWNFGDLGTSNLQNPSHTYTTPGTYNVSFRAIATDGCIGDTIKPLVVNARPVVAITQDTIYVCNNATAQFTVLNPVTGVTYNWFSAATGGTLLGTGTTFNLNNVTGFVNVYLEGIQAGCASVVRDRATAGILPTLQVPVVTVDSIGTNLLRFRWNAVPNTTGYQVSTNGGTTWITPSSGPLGLTHTITGLPLGTSVSLLVRALGGCLPAVSNPVTGQTRTDQVFIPNSFSPNNDGLNDVLRVYSNVIKDMQFTVFNQWGEKIFESSNQSIGWDGTHKNKPQPSGVYIYVCNITLTNGEKIQRKGSVNLVR